ncbi:MAG: molybdopterin-dependent oxidoreductase [Bacteroidia bacterium]
MKFLAELSFVFLLAFSVALNSCSSDKNETSSSDSKKLKNTETQLVTAPGKKEMLLITDRPPNLETPLKYFLLDFTPNDVFFVRWHLSRLPEKINTDTFRLRVGGNVKVPLAISLNDLKTKYKSYTINALCVCVGNARSSFNPRVPGAQWANGGMGNAKWTGVKLKDILEMAQPKSSSKFVSFNGLDEPPLPTVPDFVKSLGFNHSIDGEVMIAYEMNGEPLPILNGYPLKLVVPGWYATYWVGMLNEVKVYADTFKGYWMQKAYLVPKGIYNGNEKPDSLARDRVPLSKIAIRSIFVSPEPGNILKKGAANEIEGLAFDGGDKIIKVEISLDHGNSWTQTNMDAAIGKYSWRRWRYEFKPTQEGSYTFLVRATNSKGESQPFKHWNRSGYMRNEIETLKLMVK